jgi:hypothetical protein
MALGNVELPGDDSSHLVIVDRSHARLVAAQQRWRREGIQCCMVRQVLHRDGVNDRAISILDALLPQVEASRLADEFNRALRSEAVGQQSPAALACANRPRGGRPAWILRPALQKGGAPLIPDNRGAWPIRVVDSLAFASAGAGPFSLTTCDDALRLSGYGTAGVRTLEDLARRQGFQLRWLKGAGDGGGPPSHDVTLGPLVPIRIPAADGERLARATLRQAAQLQQSHGNLGDEVVPSVTASAEAPGDGAEAGVSENLAQAAQTVVFERPEVFQGEGGS